MSQITGVQLIGTQDIQGTGPSVQAMDPASQQALPPLWRGAEAAHVQAAMMLAEQAYPIFRETPLEQRAVFLETIAAEIEKLEDALILRAMAETGLPRARLEGERARTCNQLRLFARVVRDGDWIGARIDHAQPDRKPMPRSDLRLRHIAVGPVAVFGASNFPLAFSVAGGDTASALAAGCPVVVKAHPAHPGTSELVGRAVRAAIQAHHLPEGVFSLLIGPGHELGIDLVTHPTIRAVGFTGSRQGGLALMRAAAQRPQPIPVFAEMSSTNPVFLLPGALAARAEQIARDFAISLTGSAGQLCTNPGLVIGVESTDFDRFVDAAVTGVQAAQASTMLTAGIASAYAQGVSALASHKDVQILGQGQGSGQIGACQANLAITTGEAYLRDPVTLGCEVFGASALIVRCDSAEQMQEIIEALEGQLTATLQLQPETQDMRLAATMLPLLEQKVGRILANGFPTGVEVCDAMVHGGPFPATSDPRSTSVGTLAIQRFLRPVCYQDIPDTLLPEALQQANPWNIPRSERS